MFIVIYYSFLVRQLRNKYVIIYAIADMTLFYCISLYYITNNMLVTLLIVHYYQVARRTITITIISVSITISQWIVQQIIKYHLFQVHILIYTGKGDVHPVCEFCEEHFYDSHQLYLHMKNEHQTCHLCPVHFQYRYVNTFGNTFYYYLFWYYFLYFFLLFCCSCSIGNAILPELSVIDFFILFTILDTLLIYLCLG